MATPGAFVAGVLLVVVGVIVLARATQRHLTPDPTGGARLADQALSVGELYGNVVLSQLIVGGLLGGLVWLTGVPLDALGLDPPELSLGFQVTAGIGLGAVLYALNAIAVVLLDRGGIAYSEALRDALTPAGLLGWIVLLGGVLPVVALAEEVVFRAALIGGIGATTGISPVILAVLSSAAFALGHGVQGPGGVLVTGILGLALAGAFVATGSLLLVVLAHYVVNALEFVLHAGLGIQWA